MHPVLVHPSSSSNSSHSHHHHHSSNAHPLTSNGQSISPHHFGSSSKPKRIKAHEDDDEAIAKKKKNADAQAAFRLRRQTYIKSLEETVTELKNAVTEMEVLVKTANHEVKVQREEVNYLQSKLDQLSLQSAPSTPQTDSISSIPHCSCCRFQPNSLNLNKPILHPDPSSSLQSPHTPILSTSNPTTTPTQHHLDNHEWSHQSRPFNPSLLTTSHHQHDPSHPHLPHDHPHPRSSPRSDYNRILHRPPPNDLPPPSSSSYAPRSIACDMAMFEPFTPSNPINSNFYPSVEVGNPSQPANDTQSSVSPTTNAPLDMSNHANGSLQSIISSSSASRDRSPSLSRPHHLASMPPTSAFASASGPHLALHHSVPLSSPRLWSTTSQSAPHTQQSFSSESASLDPHSKPAGLFSVDESHPSSFRLNPPPRPSSEFLPSLSSPHPSHHSPYALLSQPLTGSIEEENRRRREGRAQMGSAYPPQDTSIQNPSSNSGNTFKLNGLPAKVARCEQAVMEASKVVEQAKEEVKLISHTAPINQTTRRVRKLKLQDLNHHSLPQLHSLPPPSSASSSTPQPPPPPPLSRPFGTGMA